MRGISDSNPHGTYDHHMLVIAVINDTTLKVIHYTGEVADAAADTVVSTLSSFGGVFSASRTEDVDCESGSEGATAGGSTSAAVHEQRVKIDTNMEKVELLEYPSGFELYSPENAIERARSRLGEKEYGLFKNNCECFVNWAVTGRAVSNQFESGKWHTGLGAVFGAWVGYKNEGLSGVAKGAFAGAHQSYQNYRENRP